jgi:hypothetical protein
VEEGYTGISILQLGDDQPASTKTATIQLRAALAGRRVEAPTFAVIGLALQRDMLHSAQLYPSRAWVLVPTASGSLTVLHTTVDRLDGCSLWWWGMVSRDELTVWFRQPGAAVVLMYATTVADASNEPLFNPRNSTRHRSLLVVTPLKYRRRSSHTLALQNPLHQSKPAPSRNRSLVIRLPIPLTKGYRHIGYLKLPLAPDLHNKTRASPAGLLARDNKSFVLLSLRADTS